MCYQCSRCNQCGKFSYRVAVLCKTCDEEIPAGCSKCPSCGSSALGNLYCGKLIYDPAAPVKKGHGASKKNDEQA